MIKCCEEDSSKSYHALLLLQILASDTYFRVSSLTFPAKQVCKSAFLIICLLEDPLSRDLLGSWRSILSFSARCDRRCFKVSFSSNSFCLNFSKLYQQLASFPLLFSAVLLFVFAETFQIELFFLMLSQEEKLASTKNMTIFLPFYPLE